MKQRLAAWLRARANQLDPPQDYSFSVYIDGREIVNAVNGTRGTTQIVRPGGY